MHLRSVGDGTLRPHQLHHPGHYDTAYREENREGRHQFRQAESKLFFARHRILDQNGNVFKATTVDFGNIPLLPTFWFACATTLTCFRPTEPAGTLICHTRMYSQLAPAPTRFPLASR